MTTPDKSASDLRIFFEDSDEETLHAVVALSAAESLTDDVAKRLTITAGLAPDQAGRLIRALHFCDFVTERNSEWHFATRVHSVLSVYLRDDKELYSATHTLLAELASEPDLSYADEEIPEYLLTGVGAAYHQSALSSQEGLKLYVEASGNELSGTQWLLGRLAIEQQEQGIIPPTAIEPPYLRGMILYREGRIKEAEPLLRRVADSPQIREEVAVACHLVGRIDARTSSTWERAEALLRRSLAILEEIGDQHGQAQVLHTLGQFVSKSPKRAAEAEELLRQSLAMREEIGDQYGKAQVLHTLGQFVSKSPKRAAEAEELLRQSLAIDEKNNNSYGQAQVLFTLGKLLWENNSGEAKRMLLRSIELNRQLGIKWAEQMVQKALRRLEEDKQ